MGKNEEGRDMSKELIEHARAWQTPSAPIIKALVDRIEELEREVERKMSAADFILKERDALQADNARLREALEYCVTQVGELATVPGIASALSSTPEQSIAEYRNKVIEECAAKCKDKHINGNLMYDYREECEAAILDMKEQP